MIIGRSGILQVVQERIERGLLRGGSAQSERGEADLLARIGRAMHTDQAILTVLRAAAEEIQRLRSTRGEKAE